MVSSSCSSAILGLPSVVKFSGSQEFWVDFQLSGELGDGGLVPLIPVLFRDWPYIWKTVYREDCI